MDMQEPTGALVLLHPRDISTIIAADPDDVLGKLAAKVAAFRPDISTAAGRDEMRSLAYEIAKGKTALIKIGKGLTEGWRKSTKAVNEECNVIETRMDELRDKVRAPLTAWENAEKERVAAHEAALATITASADWHGADIPCAEIDVRLSALHNPRRRDWQEFAQRAADTYAAEIAKTEAKLAAAQKREVEAAELARLRAEEAERQRQEAARLQAEREARIAAEAADRARREAEREAAEERARIVREARESEVRAQKAEADRLAAEHRAAREKKEAAELAEREQAAAIEAERKRVADAKAAEEAQAARRAAGKAHRAKINNAVLAALLACGLTDELGRVVVAAIARGEVPHVSIGY